MAFAATKFPGEIHFYVSALENKSGFEPTGHVYASERLEWFDVHDTLPRWSGTIGSKRVKS